MDAEDGHRQVECLTGTRGRSASVGECGMVCTGFISVPIPSIFASNTAMELEYGQ